MTTLILQIFLFTIAIVSGFIAYSFYRSKDGRLRILMIELFLAKVWVYGGAGINEVFHLHIVSFTLLRILLNLPMFFVMLKLWAYIRNKE